jgi:hypothetical protein
MTSNSIVEQAYGLTKTLVENNIVEIKTKSNQTLSLSKDYYEEDLENEEPEETIIHCSNENLNITLSQKGQINSGLLHSFIVGLIRNL